MPTRKPRIWTLGHSTRPIGALLALLAAHGVRHVADVRRFPFSPRHPQYNREPLRDALAATGIRYSHHARLGGRRRPRRDSANAAGSNAGWRNSAFRGYADHMRTAAFAAALRRLERIARARPTAVMCAEAFFVRCHRALIADALVVHGWRVLHIQSARTARPHVRTPFLRVRGGVLTYPAARG
jgi:uncharacterized protein (DUF488 family)